MTVLHTKVFPKKYAAGGCVLIVQRSSYHERMERRAEVRIIWQVANERHEDEARYGRLI